MLKLFSEVRFWCGANNNADYGIMSTPNWQMSGCRMKVAGRFKPCAHMGCFDIETFVELNQRSRKASDTIYK